MPVGVRGEPDPAQGLITDQLVGQEAVLTVSHGTRAGKTVFRGGVEMLLTTPP